MDVGSGAILQLDGLEGAGVKTFCERKPIKSDVKEVLSTSQSSSLCATNSLGDL